MGRPPSPFDHIKFRRALGYIALGIIPYYLLTLWDNNALSDAATFLWIHGTFFWWGRKQIIDAGMSLSFVFGSFTLSSIGLILGITTLMVFLSYGVILLYYFGLISLFGDVFMDVINEDVVDSRLGIVLGIMLVPFVEEFFFRGILMQTMVSRIGYTKGIVLSSLIFGFAHFEFISATIFGIVLALLYIKYKSLWVPIAVHTLNNAVAFLPSLLLTKVDDVSSGELLGPDTLIVGLGLVGAALPIVGILMYKWWPRSGETLPLVHNAHNFTHVTR